ncbi:E3 ubiquitin-protein ligase RNF31-like isoform X2 [Hyperolius riggenbachi]
MKCASDSFHINTASRNFPKESNAKIHNLYLLDEKQRIYEQLCSVNSGCWSQEDIQEVVSSCPDYNSALQFLSHDCPICCDQYPYSKFVKMTHCNCSFCEQCFVHHFSSVIKERSIMDVVCPICRKPDLEKEGNTEESREFFNLLDTQIHHYLDEATHELFQRKLRDRALMEMPNFCWCSHCPFGVLHEGDTQEVECPKCNKITCFNCKQQWEDIHETLSCEEFRLWKQRHEDEQLDVYLSKNGIECPSCKFRFDLWKGGCLHFKCTQCQHSFCGGCKQPFCQGPECDFSEECHGKGLHSHHTRDCFYYLRDWDTERLQQLLQMHGILCNSEFNTQLTNTLQRLQKSEKTIQKSQHDEIKEREDDGDARVDEKEFLVKIINDNFLDPADLYTQNEMEVELQRWSVSIPGHHEEDSQETYLERLRMKIKQEIPLTVNPD